MVLPDGITKDTYHSADSDLSAICAAMTGAVIAILSDELFPLEM
jgi:hypothetical protein